MVTYVKEHGSMPPGEPLLHSHVGAETTVLFHRWLIALGILAVISMFVLPRALLLGIAGVSLGMNVLLFIGVYFVLIQRNTKSHKQHAS